MPKEILFCNLIVSHKGKNIELNEVVYVEEDGMYSNKKKFDISVKVISVQVIKSLGFQAEQSGFSEVTKSDENRNSITGAYE
jgi:hypothetical protein